MCCTFTAAKAAPKPVQFGGQTPLNLARALEANGVAVIGTKPASIEAARDRELFKRLLEKLDIRQPQSGMAVNAAQAEAIAENIGYPVLMRPSFVLGGRAMAIVHSREALRRYMAGGCGSVRNPGPVLIDDFLENSPWKWTWIASPTARRTVIGHHGARGDGRHSFRRQRLRHPPRHLSPEVQEVIRADTRALARALDVRGLMESGCRAEPPSGWRRGMFTCWKSIRAPRGLCRLSARPPACRWPSWRRW